MCFLANGLNRPAVQLDPDHSQIVNEINLFFALSRNGSNKMQGNIRRDRKLNYTTNIYVSGLPKNFPGAKFDLCVLFSIAIMTCVVVLWYVLSWVLGENFRRPNPTRPDPYIVHIQPKKIEIHWMEIVINLIIVVLHNCNKCFIRP